MVVPAPAAMRSSTQLRMLAAELARSSRTCILTGAGISTDSGIPDYRSPGRPAYTPITHSEFLSNEQARRRFWLRSSIGYRRISMAHPNTAHRILANLQAAGSFTGGLITQNVDGLHSSAGSEDVLELHGSIHSVECIDCSWKTSRGQFQEILNEENDWIRNFLASETKHSMRPDGDSETALSHEEVVVPSCPNCLGIVKPAVVFYGGSIERPLLNKAVELAASCDTLLVIGTTVSVGSAFRLVRTAISNGARVLVVNRGATRADPVATVKVEDSIADTLQFVSAAMNGNVADENERQ